MRYALYLGCTVPVRVLHYEMSARRVAEGFGIELVDIGDFACCGFPIKGVNRQAASLMAGRNLVLAEENGLNICTLCSACTGMLTEANRELRGDTDFSLRLNQGITESIGKRYQGRVEVKHFARVLYEDIGLERIKERIVVDLSELNLAPHYGCHYLKPSDMYHQIEDPENPESLDQLIEVTGAHSIHYEGESQCCGGGILAMDEGTALAMTKGKLDHIKAVQGDAMVLICPFCDIMYEFNQRRIERDFTTEFKLPVLFYPQVLGLAMGIPPEELGLHLNRVKPRHLMERIFPSEERSNT